MSTTEFKIFQWLLKAVVIIPCAIILCYFLSFLPVNDPDSSSQYWDLFGFELAVTLGFSIYFSQKFQIEKKEWGKSIFKLIAIVFGCTLGSIALSFMHILKWGY